MCENKRGVKQHRASPAAPVRENGPTAMSHVRRVFRRGSFAWRTKHEAPPVWETKSKEIPAMLAAILAAEAKSSRKLAAPNLVSKRSNMLVEEW